jgi:two-component system, sensor histidine kinase and response regulator
MKQKRPSGQPPSSTPPSRAHAPAESLSRCVVRVLLLEDDVDTREVLQLLLCEDEGFHLETSADVSTCLDRIRSAAAAGHAYDVLLLDLLLPDGRSGAEVIEAAQSSNDTPLPAVVVCTALAESHVQMYRPLLDSCGARVIGKPFDADTLIDALRQASGIRSHS